MFPASFGGAECDVRLLWCCSALFGLRASRWARYYVLIVTSRPPGLAGFSARGGIGRHARFRLWCPSRRVGSTPTGRTSGRGFRSFLLPLAFHSCYDGWDAVRRVSSIWQNTSLVNWVLGVRVPHPAPVLTVARERAMVGTNKEN